MPFSLTPNDTQRVSVVSLPGVFSKVLSEDPVETTRANQSIVRDMSPMSAYRVHFAINCYHMGQTELIWIVDLIVSMAFMIPDAVPGNRLSILLGGQHGSGKTSAMEFAGKHCPPGMIVRPSHISKLVGAR